MTTTIRWGLCLAVLALAGLAPNLSEAAVKKVTAAKTGTKAAAAKAPAPAPLFDGLKELLGITALEEDVADLQAENADQQDQINTLLLAVGVLNATIGDHETRIVALEECCTDLQNRVAALEAVVNCQDTICTVDDVNYCIDTQTNHDHCDACNSPCAANENCVGGACELKPCDPVDQCHDATLMMDGTCVQTPKPNTTECDDGLGCTVEDLCQSGVCTGFGTPCLFGTCAEDGMGGFTCD